TRFRLVAPGAQAVELCRFSQDHEERRHEKARSADRGWELYRSDVAPGQRYGYRVHGPWRPREGAIFNPAKLVVDPAALALTGEPEIADALGPFDPADPTRPDGRDSAPFAPRSVVVDPDFDWGDERAPATPWSETVIYECHVRGTTRRHPDVPAPLRGTYRGLASPAVVEHLLALGVTAVELLPVQQIATEPAVARRGLTNYFGYSPLGLSAPHAGYASAPGAQVRELQQTVRDLHAAGLEVLLDVVFNHTAEGDPRGPMLSLKGIDNATFYRLDPDDPSRYEDFSGCGNTLDARREEVLDLVVAALVSWVEIFHVDGFRFDLAPVLARDALFEPAAPFFERLRAHPALHRIKLIAEPWDLGPGGYCLGRFPTEWREWNDRFRDAVRSFWSGETSSGAPFRRALAGSRGIFTPPDRGPLHSIDFVTSHDGFTLADLVSYEEKHNHANGEGNRDGSDVNLSANWGAEGPTDDVEILARRHRARRNLIATLALASGVPMLSHGDELGRSQQGNNNAYCHDSELTWIDWELDEEEREFLAFVRAAFSVGRRWRRADAAPTYVDADGEPLRDAGSSSLLFAAERITPAERLLLCVNGSSRSRLLRLPPPFPDGRLELATFATGERLSSTATLRLPPHSLAVLSAEPGERTDEP
ncbi:MAG: glycogen debranching protein GlgX, partial [Thermoanaerobaculia bacterium]|nr:glycogen debranching protein GlgX [Thermoanaerobaculia bacterium]